MKKSLDGVVYEAQVCNLVIAFPKETNVSCEGQLLVYKYPAVLIEAIPVESDAL